MSFTLFDKKKRKGKYKSGVISKKNVCLMFIADILYFKRMLLK